MKETEKINDIEEILGYECMTLVIRKAIDQKEKMEFYDIFDSWGLVKEEYLPFEAEVSVTKNGIKKRDFEIKYSNSSFQKDETGAVSRYRMIDKKNDRYVGKISYTDTGAIIRDCDEKLTEHWGHGSAKDSKKKLY